MRSWSFNSHRHRARCIRRNASILCQSFKNTITTKPEGRKEGRAFVARLNCQISFSLKDKKKHILVTNTHFLTLRISVHTSVRSHHITCGEENTAVWLCFSFFVLSLPGIVLRCCLTHAHKQNPHSSTSSNTVSSWSGTSITLFQPSFKSRSQC